MRSRVSFRRRRLIPCRRRRPPRALRSPSQLELGSTVAAAFYGEIPECVERKVRMCVTSRCFLCHVAARAAVAVGRRVFDEMPE